MRNANSGKQWIDESNQRTLMLYCYRELLLICAQTEENLAVGEICRNQIHTEGHLTNKQCTEDDVKVSETSRNEETKQVRLSCKTSLLSRCVWSRCSATGTVDLFHSIRASHEVHSPCQAPPIPAKIVMQPSTRPNKAQRAAPVDALSCGWHMSGTRSKLGCPGNDAQDQEGSPIHPNVVRGTVLGSGVPPPPPPRGGGNGTWH